MVLQPTFPTKEIFSGNLKYSGVLYRLMQGTGLAFFSSRASIFTNKFSYFYFLGAMQGRSRTPHVDWMSGAREQVGSQEV